MHGAPDELRTLAERFDATAFDAPRGSARLRLRVIGDRDWDATVEHGLMHARLRMRAWPPTPGPGAGSRTTSAAGWRRSAAAS